MDAPVLNVEGLKTHFFTRAGVVKSVDGVSLQLAPGEILGLVGESGSGKSVTGFSILGLIDPPGRIVEGTVRLEGRDLTTLDDKAMSRVRGKDLAMIFQDPMMTLNPVLKISTQLIETVLAHAPVSKAEARQRAIAALAMVGIPSPEERIDAYPHQFSGGMRQRVAIATALLHRPKVIIADEPTTALDVTIQAQILDLLTGLQRDTGMALILITHDMGVVAETAERVSVQYAGQKVEEQPVADLFETPHHPYTAALLAALPERATQRHLPTIPGVVPGQFDRPKGCLFSPRCQFADDRCRTVPPVPDSREMGFARCHYPLSAPAEAQA